MAASMLVTLLALTVWRSSAWIVPDGLSERRTCRYGKAPRKKKTDINELETRLESKFTTMKKQSRQKFREDEDFDEDEIARKDLGSWRKSAKLGGERGFLLRAPTVAAKTKVQGTKKRQTEKGGRDEASGNKNKKKSDSVIKDKTEASSLLSSLVKKRRERDTLVEENDGFDSLLLERWNTRLATDFPDGPTRIQQLTISALRENKEKDLMLSAATGSGKSLAFLLPAMAAIDENDSRAQVLVVAPTRDLAAQLGRVATDYAPPGIRIATLFGGANLKRQLETYRKRKPHLVVGTPGRLAEAVFEHGLLKLAGLKFCIIDEADEANKATYIVDIDAIVSALSSSCRIILASATCDTLLHTDHTTKMTSLERIAADCNAAGHRVDAGEFSSNQKSTIANALVRSGRVAHARLMVNSERDAFDTLRKVLRGTDPPVSAALVFVDSPEVARDLSTNLIKKCNLPALQLTGQESAANREAALRTLRRLAAIPLAKGEDPVVLIATEVAARGLDAPAISHVINFLSLPSSAAHYAHRGGRTARGPSGKPGFVLTIARPRESRIIDKLQTDLGLNISLVESRLGSLVLVPKSKEKE